MTITFDKTLPASDTQVKIAAASNSSTGTPTVTFVTVGTVTASNGATASGCTLTEAGALGDIVCNVTHPGTTTATITIKGAKVTSNVTAGAGTKVTATATLGKFTTVSAIFVAETGVTGAHLTPTSAEVATYVSPPAVPTVTVTGHPTHPITAIVPGKNSQSAGTWSVAIHGANTTAGWRTGNTISLPVDYSGTLNCATTTKYVFFAATPTVAVTSTTTTSHLSATPTFTVTTTHVALCSAFEPNEVVIKFTNSGTFTATAGGTIVLTITAVKYDVGATTPVGTVKVVGGEYHVKTTNATHAVTDTSSQNARVSHVYVTANTPAVKVAPSSVDTPISPVKLTEAVAGVVPGSAYVCVMLQSTATSGSGNSFDTTATATAKVTGGNAAVTSKVTYPSATTAAFKVTTASKTTKPSTFIVSGLAVNATSSNNKTPFVVVTDNRNATCTTGTSNVATAGVATAVAFTTGATSTQIYGATADATAAKLLENRFVATPGSTTCPGGKATSANTRPVILATTAHFQDALSSQYLASYLDTGTLLTPTAKLSTVTLQALRTEGITQVDVVGGPLVVSTTVIAQLETTPAYTCGGGSKLTVSGGGTRFLSVTRIYGHTAVETARAIADTPPSTHVLKKSFLTAYIGVNATKGNGAFNDTAGSASPIPLTSAAVPTAILASTTEFQDAMAASTLSYWQPSRTVAAAEQGFPILLTNPMGLSAAAQDAIATLGIKQVILMGGQLAVTNSVVTSLEGLGVEVLRVAGHSYTDTSTQLAKFEESKTGLGLNWDSATTVAVARGNGFTDGLVGADVAGFNKWPLLLTTSPTVVGKYLTAFLKAHGAKGTSIDTGTGETAKIDTLKIFGGPLAVSPAVISQMETDIS